MIGAVCNTHDDGGTVKPAAPEGFTVTPVLSGSTPTTAATTVGGVDGPVLVAFGLLVAGVVASVVPGVPGSLLSVGGIGVYWWGTGFAEPSTLLVGVLVVLALLALVGSVAGEVVAARLSGASTRTAAVAGPVGFALFFVLGPLGLLVGVAGTVFGLEYRRHRDVRASAGAALGVVVGSFAATAVQVLLTGTVLAVMVVVAFL